MSFEFLARHKEQFESGIHLLLASIVNCFPGFQSSGFRPSQQLAFVRKL